MFKKNFQRLYTNTSSSHSKFSFSSLLFIWSCLNITSMSQSISPTLSPSYLDHGHRTLTTTQDTLYYELSSSPEIQLSNTMGFTQEVSNVHSTTSLPEMILMSKEVTPSSNLSELTHTSHYLEITSDFTDDTKFPIPILSTSLHIPFESPESSVYNSEIHRCFTPSLALSFSSTKIPDTRMERTVRSYDSTSTINLISDHGIVSPSPISTSKNIASASTFSISPSESFKLFSNTADATHLPTFYSNSTTESEQVNNNSSDSTITSSVTKKSNTKYESVRYFLVLKTEDCPPLGTSNLNSEIQRALSSLGIIKVKAKISKMGCQTTLHVNITARAPSSAVINLDEVSNQNLTISVFNRSFQITDILQQQSNFNKTDARLTSNVINLVAQSIFKAYVAVGSCFGLVLLVCVVGYCYKCWSNNSRKRLGPRSNHSPLSPEDYTLTPIPRPTSLYVDYYRNSLTADLYSTTSAGSAGSASPIVEAGVVQPFDTSIVPLEDSETHFQDSKPQRDSAQSANEGNVQVVTVDGLIYCNSGNDSTEKLNPNQAAQQQKATGVCNPTYQRY